MPIRLEPHTAEKVLVLRYIAPVNPDDDLPASVQAIVEFSHTVQGDFFVISDTRAFQLTFDVLVEVLDLVRRQLVGVPVHFVIVGTGEIVRLAAEAITQKQYGSFDPAKVFATDQEAFAHCLAELQKSA
jgi:hypothetical protein